MMEGRGGRRSPMLALLGLHAVNEYYRLPWKPPVTAALLSANTLIYLRPAFLHPLLPSLRRASFNPYLVLKHRDIIRFFLAPFYHVNDSHLVYNMMSLLWKGIQLETSMGSAEFAAMVSMLLALSQGISLLLAKSLLLFFNYDTPFYSEYSVGFSGVLFAMKVVLNSQSGDFTYVHGLMLPARHAAWAELILIQMFVPGVSFLGHLAGILAGLVYLKLKRSYNNNLGLDPLAVIVKGIGGVLSWPLRFVGNLFGVRRGRISGRGTVGRDQTAMTFLEVWRCQACTYDNSRWLSECEMCGTSRDNSGGSSFYQSSHHSDELSLEEIRRRRIQRFGR